MDCRWYYLSCMSSPILQSWHANAAAWNEALLNEELETRVLVTNQAVVSEILSHAPASVLDLGCGEGWLCRALHTHGIGTAGVDGTAELVELARQKHPEGQYTTCSFEQLAEAADWPLSAADLFVINFSLYEHELCEKLLRHLHTHAAAGTKLVIQTLHPLVYLPPGKSYEDQWMQEDWAGMQRAFSHPYRWYFRTIGSWLTLLQQTGWQFLSLKEPLHPKTKKPASLLLTARA